MKLIMPSMQYDEQIQAFRQEFLASGDSMDGSSSLRKFANTQDWINQLEPDTTQYIAVRKADDKVVGVIQIRHRFNEFLEKYAGHIGYCVCPSERRKGYATQMLAGVLPECRRLEILDVLVCCLKENEASRRTILRNGGVFESKIFEPQSRRWIERYWIHLT